MNALNTPVLFIVFNRPETTKKVFEAIRLAKPRQLFVAADGPRSDKAGEEVICEEVKRIATNVDWDCEVKVLFRTTNLGCGRAPSEAISWFFEAVEYGIILEDDCLPEQSFFKFSEEMLLRYKNEERIMMISGTNYFFNSVKSDRVYYFSNMVFIWGWATWRRAWKNFRFDSTEPKIDSLAKRFTNKDYLKLIVNSLERVKKNELVAWDLQWLNCICLNNGLSIIPIQNQVRNIGYFGVHSNTLDSPFLNMPTSPIDITQIPIHTDIKADPYLDQVNMDNIIKYEKKNNIQYSFFRRIFYKLKSFFK
jgi:hypothetical protein